MGVIAWILLGLVAGFIGNRIMGPSNQGLLMDIVLGIVGAVVGGLIVSMLTGVGITGFNIWSILVAILGAVVVQWGYRQMTGRSI